MNLVNKRLLAQKIQSFEFPEGQKMEAIKRLLEGWQKALKDSDLEKTKEKSVQGKFLNTFFENILGYIDMTTGLEEWTLIQHPRIENEGREPDGSLGWFTKDHKFTRAVIELKDAHTSLDKKQNSRGDKLTPIEQAYFYATKYEDCNWIIASNFREIRLYNYQKTQDYFETFDVLDLLDEAEFKRFYFMLCKKNLISKGEDSVMEILAKDTFIEEQNITKEFYGKYRDIRLYLLQHLISYNPTIERTILLEKAQKLLDRFIFTLFCEDTTSLLPLNIVKNTYERALNSFSSSDERIWTEYRGLFQAIDKGNDRVKPPINAYNGGLFAHDDILDNLSIKDSFWETLIKLADYDFETDLNVNILGHIFEQSISDLEKIKFQWADNTDIGIYIGLESKRKKDGIFYTPEYVTRYIIEQTLGKYLDENTDRLTNVKVLDPSCGSGAFLNQAHTFLLNEHRNRFEQLVIEKELKGEHITLFDYNPAEANKSILLNNLYGVDLNQESVEITKLALWLKTARITEPLQNLDKNIKCGNSLIDDIEVAGSKAFNWTGEFSSVFSDGGFDVVIGNPPYVRNELISITEKEYLEKNYDTYTGKSDLYVYFFEQFIKLLRPNGIGGMIVSSKYTKTKYGKTLIDYLNKKVQILEFIDFNDSDIFEGIIAYPSIIIFKKTDNREPVRLGVINDESVILNDLSIAAHNFIKVDQNMLFESLGGWARKNNKELSDIFRKVRNSNNSLEDMNVKPQVGIKTGLNKAFILTQEEASSFGAEFVKPYLLGKDVKKYQKAHASHFIIFPYKKDAEGKLYLVEENELPEVILSHLKKYKEELSSRAIIKDGLEAGTKKWYEYQQIKLDFNYNNYIIYPDISNGVNFSFAENAIYDMTCFGINSADSNLLALLNSKFIASYLETVSVKARGGYLRMKSQYINTVPIPRGLADADFNQIVTQLQTIFHQTKELVSSFNSTVEAEYNVRLNFNLQELQDLGSNELIEILNKRNAHLQLEKKEDAINWLKAKKTEAQSLQAQLVTLEDDIDRKIYRLFDLSPEEISIIEDKS